MWNTYCFACGGPSTNVLKEEAYIEYVENQVDFFIPSYCSKRIEKHPFKDKKKRENIIERSKKINKNQGDWLKEGFRVLYTKIDDNFERITNEKVYITEKSGMDDLQGSVKIDDEYFSCHFFTNKPIIKEKAGFAIHGACWDLLCKKSKSNNLEKLWDVCKKMSKDSEFFIPLNVDYGDIFDYMSQWFWGPLPGDEWIVFRPSIPKLPLKEKKTILIKRYENKLFELPNEILLNIFHFLDPKNILKFEGLSKNAQCIVKELDKPLWSKMSPLIENNSNSEKNHVIDYKEWYKLSTTLPYVRNTLRISKTIDKILSYC